MTKALTAKQKLFVEAYCTEANFNAVKAVGMAGYDTINPSRRAYDLMHSSAVTQAIELRLEKKKRTMWLKEDDIIEGLYKEATFMGNGANHSARVAAWVHLGKHLGMFREKVEEKDTQVTYNIINYNTKNPELERKTHDAIESFSQEDIIEGESSVDSSIEIKNYSREE